MRRSKFIFLFIGLCSILLGPTACSFTASTNKKEDPAAIQARKDSIALLYDSLNVNADLDRYMQRLHQRSGFNGNVLIAKNGKVVYQNSFGWANHLLRDSLKIESQFELASVSKPLTAIAILKLVEEGKISLEQSVQDFFPEFPYPGVTVLQLLSHRSGLPNYIYFLEEVWSDKRVGVTNTQAIDLLTKHQPARYGAPDGRFFYNNTNYMLLAGIIEKASGLEFAVYMQEEIFKPTGMKNTAVYSKATYDKIPTHVIGHDKVWRRSVVQNFLDGPVGDKGIYSTVQDLYLLDRALKEGRIISLEMQEAAYQGYSKLERGAFGYGLGWRTFEKEGQKTVYHTGWWHGFRNLYVRDITNDVTIVLLSNMANNSLLHLDELYQILEIPVIRQAAYSGKGEYLGSK